MGQYYKIVILSTKERKVSNKKKIITGFFPDWGVKLMEWSYVGNVTTRRLENVLYENPQRVVVAGDYADEEPQNCKDSSGEWVKENLYHWIDKVGKLDEKPYLVYGKSKDCSIEWENYGRAAEEKAKIEPHHRYAINEDKKLYVDLGFEPKRKLKLHKLALLLAEGNGRGGGDYRGINEDKVGMWARDLIRVSDERPYGYKKLNIQFKKM